MTKHTGEENCPHCKGAVERSDALEQRLVATFEEWGEKPSLEMCAALLSLASSCIDGDDVEQLQWFIGLATSMAVGRPVTMQAIKLDRPKGKGELDVDMPTSDELDAAMVKYGVPLLMHVLRKKAPNREMGLMLLAVAFSLLRDAGVKTGADASFVAEAMWATTENTQAQFRRICAMIEKLS